MTNVYFLGLFEVSIPGHKDKKTVAVISNRHVSNMTDHSVLKYFKTDTRYQNLKKDFVIIPEIVITALAKAKDPCRCLMSDDIHHIPHISNILHTVRSNILLKNFESTPVHFSSYVVFDSREYHGLDDWSLLNKLKKDYIKLEEDKFNNVESLKDSDSKLNVNVDGFILDDVFFANVTEYPRTADVIHTEIELVPSSVLKELESLPIYGELVNTENVL